MGKRDPRDNMRKIAKREYNGNVDRLDSHLDFIEANGGELERRGRGRYDLHLQNGQKEYEITGLNTVSEARDLLEGVGLIEDALEGNPRRNYRAIGRYLEQHR